MQTFKVYVLGCGAASPTSTHFPSSQVVNYNERLFVVDCGEGFQMQFRRMKLTFSRIEHVFISHLHADHCLGLPGLISTLDLIGRTTPLYIHAHPDIEKFLTPFINFFCEELSFEVKFECFSPEESKILFEDEHIKVSSIPLVHRCPSSGFLFKEKEKPKNLIPERVEYYHIPIASRQYIKQGMDFTTENGEIIPNKKLTLPPSPPRSYAYCSDTMYLKHLGEKIEGVDLLYHESTFIRENEERAKKTLHSTAFQAASVALQARAKKLLLGHYSARYKDENVFLEEAKSIFPNTFLSYDLSSWEV